MTTTVVTIGLSSNRTLRPLADAVRESFVRDVRELLSATSSAVFVDAATSVGEWCDTRTGVTVIEESRTWVADTLDPRALTTALADLAARYEQDAIACTIGETTLVRAGTSMGAAA